MDFFRKLNVDLQIGNASRVPAVRDMLERENRKPDGMRAIVRIIEACLDPRDYVDNERALEAVVEYLNKRLRYDGFELRKRGKLFKVVASSANAVAAALLQERTKALDLSSVREDFERANQEAESDPADAITAACATVESVCKCILDEMGKAYPANKDIKGLVGEVAKYLNLAPGRTDLPKEWEHDIRTVLSGLYNVIGGIGALRTHAGDAHGKGKRAMRADSRIARLAINAACTVSLFYIETWQRSVEKSRTHRA